MLAASPSCAVVLAAWQPTTPCFLTAGPLRHSFSGETAAVWSQRRRTTLTRLLNAPDDQPGPRADGTPKTQPVAMPERFNSKQLMAVIPAVLMVWLCAGTVFFHDHSRIPWGSAFFYSVDTGLSIGFGALQPKDDIERLVIMLNVLFGAGIASGALALFTDRVLKRNPALSILSEEMARQRGKGGDWNPQSRSAMPSRSRSGNAITGVSGSGRVHETMGTAAPANETWAEGIFCVYIFIGLVYGVVAEGYTPISALYFAITSLSTGGHQTPTIGASLDSNVAAFHGWFVGLYCLTGVPIWAANLGNVASKVLEELVRRRQREIIMRPLTRTEFQTAKLLIKKREREQRRIIETELTQDESQTSKGLVPPTLAGGGADETIDRTEFIILELLRLEKIDLDTVHFILKEFERVDADGNGELSYEEVFGLGSPRLTTTLTRGDP